MEDAVVEGVAGLEVRAVGYAVPVDAQIGCAVLPTHEVLELDAGDEVGAGVRRLFGRRVGGYEGDAAPAPAAGGPCEVEHVGQGHGEGVSRGQTVLTGGLHRVAAFGSAALEIAEQPRFAEVGSIGYIPDLVRIVETVYHNDASDGRFSDEPRTLDEDQDGSSETRPPPPLFG